MLVSTVDEPSPYVIVATHGTAIGTEARPLNRFADGVKQLNPGDIRDYPQRLRAARQDAIAQMCEHAHALGANAVVGVRFDSRPLAESWHELCAYGTAVTVVERAERPIPVQSSPMASPRPRPVRLAG